METFAIVKREDIKRTTIPDKNGKVTKRASILHRLIREWHIHAKANS